MGVLLKRQHMRLADYDYSRVGAYFVTICAVDRKCLFGQIGADEMRLNQIGSVVASCWGEIPKHFRVTLDEFVVMPNHLHRILLLAGHARPLPRDPQQHHAVYRYLCRVSIAERAQIYVGPQVPYLVFALQAQKVPQR